MMGGRAVIWGLQAQKRPNQICRKRRSTEGAEMRDWAATERKGEKEKVSVSLP